ncbi:HopJ type III effector protein [Salegentibacter sp. F188]|uniref:HopJ type III effector protein n=1 Tax=Autumnicola patrickiae TaxID=3075591 RepID=A0ABU3E303_9FLAO|nr:HopJ type III effector protein [Salegentibacter sp. F188]MDT0690352.1 HopJ type III effector protein [Salegentibacter sp. F188]
MKIAKFITTLKENPEQNTFAQTMKVIDAHYKFTPTAFKNGKLKNEPGENNGSCKIFYFGKLHDLSEKAVLACFGEVYFEDVLKNPEGTGHQNIRNFMNSGWSKIEFKGEALQPE